MEKSKEKAWFTSLLNKLLIVIIVIWSVLAIIFGFTDLLISITVVDQTSAWGQFGADYGEAPGYGLIAVGIAILIAAGVEKKTKDLKKQKIPALIIAIIALFIMIIGILERSQDTAMVGGGIAFSLLLFIAIAYKKNWAEYKTIAIVIVLLAIINPLLFIQITKVLCGRVRFRDLASNYSNYTPWFAPPGLSSGLKGNASFPSGHTAMSFMFLPLLILVREREWQDPVKIFSWILVIGWALFVGASRVVVGAHYASDVLFSAGVASVLTIFLYKKVFPTNQ